jgi:hypothetical protein
MCVSGFRFALGRFFLRAGLLIALPFTDYPRARKHPEHILNRNPRQAVGYLASLGSILCGQRFAIFATSTKCAVVQDLDFKE